MFVAAACVGFPHHLPGVIYADCRARPQVSHLPIAVKEGVVVAADAIPHYLPTGIDAVCVTAKPPGSVPKSVIFPLL